MTKSKNTELVQTRISPKTHKIIKKKAEAEGMSVAAYVRRLLLDEYRKANPGKDPYR